MPELSPALVLFLTAVLLFGGFAKGTIGFGLIVTTVPFLSMVMPPSAAMAWMAIPIFLLNLYAIALTWAEWRAIRRVAIFLFMGILFVPAGVRLVVWMPAGITRAGIGVFILIVVAMRLGGLEPAKIAGMGARWVSALWGCAAGLIHGSLMMPAPPIVLYLNFSGVPKDAFVFLISTVAASFLLVQVITFASLDSYTSGAGWQSLLMLAPATLGTWLGNRFRQTLSQTIFERLVMGLLGIVGISLLAKNLVGLF